MESNNLTMDMIQTNNKAKEKKIQGVADAVNATVVSPDYTLSLDPDYKYPTELEEEYAGLLYAYEHADELNVLPRRSKQYETTGSCRNPLQEPAGKIESAFRNYQTSTRLSGARYIPSPSWTP